MREFIYCTKAGCRTRADTATGYCPQHRSETPKIPLQFRLLSAAAGSKWGPLSDDDAQGMLRDSAETQSGSGPSGPASPVGNADSRKGDAR